MILNIILAIVTLSALYLIWKHPDDENAFLLIFSVGPGTWLAGRLGIKPIIGGFVLLAISFIPYIIDFEKGSKTSTSSADIKSSEKTYTPSNNYSSTNTSFNTSTATSTSVSSNSFKVSDQTDVTLTGIPVITKEIANMYPLLTNLTIGQGVNKIDVGAFGENARLEKVIIDTDLVEIGSYAFSNAEKLREVVGIDRVMEIGYKAFSSCSSLSIVKSTFKSSRLKTIGQEAFFKCENLSTVVLPNQPVIFAKACFSECEKLQSIGEVVYASSILNDAFLGCKSLKSFRFGNAPHTIGSYAFACCCNLEYMFIPEGTTYIGSYAFSACGRLEVISFPRTITFMGDRVLEGSLDELSSLTLPASLEHRLNDILGPFNPDFIDLSRIIINYI